MSLHTKICSIKMKSPSFIGTAGANVSTKKSRWAPQITDQNFAVISWRLWYGKIIFIVLVPGDPSVREATFGARTKAVERIDAVIRHTWSKDVFKWPISASFSLFSLFSNTNLTDIFFASACIELILLGLKASTLTTWPPPRPNLALGMLLWPSIHHYWYFVNNWHSFYVSWLQTSLFPCKHGVQNNNGPSRLSICHQSAVHKRKIS